jgi:hypothetical protein
MYHDDIGKPYKNQSNKGGDNGLQFVSVNELILMLKHMK